MEQGPLISGHLKKIFCKIFNFKCCVFVGAGERDSVETNTNVNFFPTQKILSFHPAVVAEIVSQLLFNHACKKIYRSRVQGPLCAYF